MTIAQTLKNSCRSHRALLVLMAVGALSSWAAGARAQSDNRVSIDPSQSVEFSSLVAIATPARMVGSTDKLSSHIGSGFMIDRCHAMTNVHVVDDYRVVMDASGKVISGDRLFSGAKLMGKHVKVYGGWRGLGAGSEPTLVSDAEVVAVGHAVASDSKAATVGMEYAGDWAVLRLVTPIGDQVGFLPVQPVLPSRAETLSVDTAGFPGDKSARPASDDNKWGVVGYSHAWGTRSCRIVLAALNYWYSTCISYFGASGSPVTAKGADGRFYAIALVSGGFSKKGAEPRPEPAIMTPLNTINQKNLRALMDETPCETKRQ